MSEGRERFADNAVCIYKADIESPPLWDDFSNAAYEMLRAIDLKLPKATKAVIKPNITTAPPPESGIATHPAFVRGIIRYLKEEGGFESDRILVAECARGNLDTAQRFKDTDYLPMTEAEGVTFVNLDRDPVVRVPIPGGRIFREMGIARTIVAEDTCFINVPKLKTHNFAITTLCMKNLMGTICPFNERHICQVFPRYEGDDGRDLTLGVVDYEERFTQKLCDLARAVQPYFNIIEGIVGREGTGFHRGRNRQTNLVVAGANMVAVDSVASYLMGFEPTKMPYLRLAGDLGLGPNDVREMAIYALEGGELVRCQDLGPYMADPPFEVIRYYEQRRAAP
jgi:uncharacterized protein (DUF362 family)